ncbi:MAG TPA: carboxylesterase family protein, partial [Caulobacteraceae bacterium]|nr:carboxylesterase family protein [Caulobacteraceae bacterium]
MTSIARLLALCAAVVLVPMLAAAAPDSRPVIDAPAGAVKGVAEGDLEVFKGLPYAQPPVGPARWTPPRAMARW